MGLCNTGVDTNYWRSLKSLRRGHANLLCIVPILTDDLRRGSVKLKGKNPCIHPNDRVPIVQVERRLKAKMANDPEGPLAKVTRGLEEEE